MATLHYLRQVRENRNQVNSNQSNNILNSNQPTKWYESLWGLVVLTLGLNLLSNFIYDKGREQLRLQDERRQRRRNIDELVREGKSEQEAEAIEDAEDAKLDKEQKEGDFGPPN